MIEANLSRENWDTVIIGAGVAGLVSALAAAEVGGKIIVLEKAADIKDTNTSRSGGSIAFAKEKEMYPDRERMSVAEMVQEAWRLGKGNIDLELVKTWREQIDATLDWLEAKGLLFQEPEIALFEASSRQAAGKGAGLNKQLLNMVQNSGCDLRFNTRVETLLRNNSGRVVGVRAMTAAGLKDFMAERGIILATGGFQANQEMLLRYMGPEFTYNLRLTGTPRATGDGHRMAAEVGAQLLNMDQFHCRQDDRSLVHLGLGRWERRGLGPRQLQPYHHYGIFVNQLGRRFIDEYAPATRSNAVSCSIMRQPGAMAAYLWDDRIRKLMGSKFDRYVPPGVIIEAASIAELAEKTAIQAESLQQTILEYNEAVAAGTTRQLAVPRTDHAMRIEHPPFYAIYPAYAGLNCTLGGPRVNSRSQVISMEQIPIPGLYACGEMIGGFFWGDYEQNQDGSIYYRGTYQVLTSALSAWVVFARIAGYEAARSGGMVR